MEIFDTLLAVLGYGVLGFFGLLVAAMVFGKRVEKQWEFEAKFRNEGGRELGEFDIELRRVVEEGAEWTLDAEFKLRHAALKLGHAVAVYLDDQLVMQGEVQESGRIRMDEGALTRDPDAPCAGQICSVRLNGEEMFAEALYED